VSLKASLKEKARAYLESEKGTIFRQGRMQIALCYPSPYSVAHASLGYQVIYRAFNQRPDFVCERAVYPDEPQRHHATRTPLFTLESQRPVSAFDLVAFSLAFELELPHLIEMLDLSGIAPLAQDRTSADPPIVIGGPVTLSNALPLGVFADVVVMGDGEVAVEHLMDAMESASSKSDFLKRCADLPGLWVPTHHGDNVPDNQKVDVSHLPAVGQIVTPHSDLSNMFLIETSRGCPRMCTFCVVRGAVSPMREADPQAVLDAIPEWAERVGYVGAAVTDYRHIKEVLRGAVERGKELGISSLRADRLDEEMVTLLRQGGYRTMTVAADAPSEKMRSVIMKGIRERHLVRAAELARWVGFKTMKLYMVVGLPGETKEDLEDLVQLCEKLSDITPLAITLSPFVPKLHTPLATAPFAGIKEVDATLKMVRRSLKGKVDIRSTSARWAWIEYRMSQGGMDTGIAALQAHRAGGRFAHWKEALESVEQPRQALALAEEHGTWPVDGVNPDAPPPPKPPKRLPWEGTSPKGPRPVFSK